MTKVFTAMQNVHIDDVQAPALKSSPTYVQMMQFEVAPADIRSHENLEIMGVKISPRNQEDKPV